MRSFEKQHLNLCTLHRVIFSILNLLLKIHRLLYESMDFAVQILFFLYHSFDTQYFTIESVTWVSTAVYGSFLRLFLFTF